MPFQKGKKLNKAGSAAVPMTAVPMTANISLYISRPQKSQPIKNLLNMKIPLQKTPHRESK